ncbi:MAG: S8 family serine peptidase, partial [Planctomycetota bacterium]
MTAALSAAGAALSEVLLPPDDPRIYFTGGPEVARAAARLDGVRRVELVRTDYEPLNGESRPVIQSGSVDGGAIYHQSGITGVGQVVGLMDEGLNLDTLLLADTASQAGSAGPTHRKVYGYSPNWGDFETCACPAAGGFSHGTMAAQAIAGREPNPPVGTFGVHAGIAPDSKIFFQDAKVAGGMSCSDPQNDDLNLPTPLDLAFAEFSFVVPVSTCDTGGVCTGNSSLSCNSDEDCALQDRQGLLWVGPFGSPNGGYCVNAGDSDEQLWNNRDSMLFYPVGNDAEVVHCPGTAKNVISAGGHYQYPHLDIYGAVNGASLVCSVTGAFCTTDADCAADRCVDDLCSLSGGACVSDLDCATDTCANSQCTMTGASCSNDSDCPLNPCIDPTLTCEGTSVSCTSDAHCEPGVSCVGAAPELTCLLSGGSCTTGPDCPADECEESVCSLTGGPCAGDEDCVQNFCGVSASRRTQPMLLAPACDLPGGGNFSVAGQQSDSCFNEPSDLPSSTVHEGTCGTSFSSAYLAGAAALVRDYYRQGFHEGCADPTAGTCGQPNAAAGLSPSGAL